MNKVISFLLIGIIISFSSCEQDSPENPVQFADRTLTLSAGSDEVTVKLTLERAADDNIPVTVNMQSSVVTHRNEFIIEPESAEVNGTIFLAVPKGAQEASFKVRKMGNPPLTGEEMILFNIASAAAPVVIGQKSTLEVNFQ